MNFFLQNKIVSGLVIAILVVGGLLAAQSGSSADAPTAESASSTAASVVRLINPQATSSEVLSTSGEVETKLKATISSETSGVIKQVPVEIGDRVARGAVLATFSNADERAAVAQAGAGLASQQARLKELKAGARPAELDNSAVSVETAETNLAEAEEALLNTDLQAYLLDEDASAGDGSLQQPVISGTYSGGEAGEYRLDLYGSGSESGYSFRYSGLESGIAAASAETPQPLGSRGLYIKFPENFAANRNIEWVVPVPNTRSTQYITAKRNLDRAKQTLKQAKNNLEIAADGARSEQIEAQAAQVDSAEASLASAEARLAKTIVRAPFSGTVLSVAVRPGEYRSVGQPIVKLLDETSLEVQTFVTAENAGRISVGDMAEIDNEYEGRVIAVAPAVDSDSGNVEVRLAVSSTANLVSGSFVDVTFNIFLANQADELTLPLSAVNTTTAGTFVLVVNDDNVLESVQIEVGGLVGSRIEVTGSLPAQIVVDTKGVAAGDRVVVENDDE